MHIEWERQVVNAILMWMESSLKWSEDGHLYRCLDEILHMEEPVENCWLEAFRSDTSVVNYMRLAQECKAFTRVREEVRQIYDAMHVQMKNNPYAYNSRGELQENRVEQSTSYMLIFLGGEFQYVKEQVMNTRDSLGWSWTFMKCGLAAFMLLLLEGDSLQSGCREMCRRVVCETGFDNEKYQFGTLKTISKSSQEWFWECFCHWKKMTAISGKATGDDGI